jgi:hypothetical protein
MGPEASQRQDPALAQIGEPATRTALAALSFPVTSCPKIRIDPRSGCIPMTEVQKLAEALAPSDLTVVTC